MQTVAKIPATNIKRFNSLKTATSYRDRQSYYVQILLGDDGRFWVASTPKETVKLIRAGYEAA